MKTFVRAIVGACACVVPALAQAAEWSWQWPAGAAGDAAPQVEVCPYLYGKEWAYAVEIDDGPVLVRDIAQPLFAKQHFSDAPPGVSGGKALPFVGGVSVMVVRVGGNNTFLSWDDLRKLQGQGWGIINHSYYHKGRTWGEPPEILSAGQVRDDLFWSQAVIAEEMGGRPPTHFVYPNGYMGYAEYLGEFGMHSGTRVGGSSVRFPYAPEAKPLDATRSYLDEGNWKKWGNAEALWDFPAKDGPAPGEMVIDFTHGIDKPGTENHTRWEKRLDFIGQTYGTAGKDSIWCAPSGEIFDYVNARKQAKVSVTGSGIRVSVPDSLAGSRLTLKASKLQGDLGELPEGTVAYRQADTVWITTPVIGQAGAAPVAPAVKRVYAGPAQSTALEKPSKIAAIRLLQQGGAAAGNELKIVARTPDGQEVSLITPEQKTLADGWGIWHLYSLVPNREAVMADRVEITADPSVRQMEIWVTE